MEPVRVAIVGLGYWGPHYARILTELAGAELAWCCDRDPGALELPRTRYPAARLSTDPTEVLADPSVDAVIVATPTRTHAELTLACLLAGKDVLVEKPVAASLQECEAIEREVGDRILMVGHTFLFNPAVVALRELVAGGDLGRLHYLNAVRAALGPIREDVNVLWDLAPHDVSIFLDIVASQPVKVGAVGQGYLRADREDVVYLYIRFADDTIAHAHLSWLEPYKVRRITVVGDQRMAVFDDVATDERLKILDRGASYSAPAEQARGQSYGEYRAVVRDGTIVIPQVPRREPLTDQVSELVDCVRERREPYSALAGGRAVVAVLEAATRSLHEGGAPQPVG